MIFEAKKWAAPEGAAPPQQRKEGLPPNEQQGPSHTSLTSQPTHPYAPVQKNW